MLTRRALIIAPVLAFASEPGFTSLFDGRTLAGWRICEGPESAFYVESNNIVVHTGSNFPTWLRSEKMYENFDFRGEFFLRGWMDSGLFLHAPEHGRATACGLEINLFHQQEEHPTPYSVGAIFPIVAPAKVNVKNKGEWNSFRVLCDWPKLAVWMNDEQIHDLDMEEVPDLRFRVRRGYLGFESLSYPIRFRNLRVRELPDKEKWTTLYQHAGDAAKWHVSDREPRVQELGSILRLEGNGNIAFSKQQFKDFELQCYIRGSRQHNGGVVFRSSGQGTKGERAYEIQLHNVEGAHFPTGSLYHYKRARYPKIEDEKWFLFQLIVSGHEALVRINGEDVMEYGELKNLDAGFIELQAHAEGTWTEYKLLRIKPI